MELEHSKYLSIQEVADMLHLKNRKVIDNWLFTGALPRDLTFKIGSRVFFHRTKLEEFIENSTNQSQGE